MVGHLIPATNFGASPLPLLGRRVPSHEGDDAVGADRLDPDSPVDVEGDDVDGVEVIGDPMRPHVARCVVADDAEVIAHLAAVGSLSEEGPEGAHLAPPRFRLALHPLAGDLPAAEAPQKTFLADPRFGHTCDRTKFPNANAKKRTALRRFQIASNVMEKYSHEFSGLPLYSAKALPNCDITTPTHESKKKLCREGNPDITAVFIDPKEL